MDCFLGFLSEIKILVDLIYQFVFKFDLFYKYLDQN